MTQYTELTQINEELVPHLVHAKRSPLAVAVVLARFGVSSRRLARGCLYVLDSILLALVPEGDPITEGTLSDSKEVYKIASYGKILGVTRQMIVNDDVSAMTRIPQILGASAAVTESDVAWAVVLDNGLMSDGNPVFHTSRGNVSFSTTLDAAAIEAARAYFRGLTSENGAVLGIEPKYVVVGINLAVDAERLLAPPAVYSTGTITNVLTDSLRSQLELVVEPRIPPGEFYVFAGTSRIDGAEYAWLNGQRGPVVETETDFATKAINISVIDDFGAGVIDSRGMYKGTAAVA